MESLNYDMLFIIASNLDFKSFRVLCLVCKKNYLMCRNEIVAHQIERWKTASLQLCKKIIAKGSLDNNIQRILMKIDRYPAAVMTVYTKSRLIEKISKNHIPKEIYKKCDHISLAVLYLHDRPTADNKSFMAYIERKKVINRKIKQEVFRRYLNSLEGEKRRQWLLYHTLISENNSEEDKKWAKFSKKLCDFVYRFSTKASMDFLTKHLNSRYRCPTPADADDYNRMLFSVSTVETEKRELMYRIWKNNKSELLWILFCQELSIQFYNFDKFMNSNDKKSNYLSNTIHYLIKHTQLEILRTLTNIKDKNNRREWIDYYIGCFGLRQFLRKMRNSRSITTHEYGVHVKPRKLSKEIREMTVSFEYLTGITWNEIEQEL